MIQEVEEPINVNTNTKNTTVNSSNSNREVPTTKVQLNTSVISKIAAYLSDPKVYEFATKAANKTVSRHLYSICLRKSTYIFYMKDTPEIVTLPSKKLVQSSKIPKKNFESFNNKALPNYAFFYNNNEKEVHTFQFNPFDYVLIKIDEAIDEIYLYKVNSLLFYMIVNQVCLYKVQNLKIIEKVPLTEGFFFEQVLIDDYLYSDFFGDQLIVNHLTKNSSNDYESYKLKFKLESHYDIIGKDMVVIDFSGEDVVDDVLPKSDKKREDLKNCLFRFSLVKGTPNKISLEFIDYLPSELKIERFDDEQYLFMSRHLEEKYMTFWHKSKCLGRYSMEHPDGEKVVNISNLADNRIMVEYITSLVVIDFLKCCVINKVDLKSREPKLKFNCSIDCYGDYYHQTLLVEQEELGAWRNYILDQNFEKVVDIEGDDYAVFNE